MLFDLHPKENLKDLFGREEEFKELERLIKTEWVVVLGRRMVGKTSLVKTFAKEKKGVYINLMGINTVDGFIDALYKAVSPIIKNYTIDLKLVNIRFYRLAEDIISRIPSNIIILDEAQELTSIHFHRFLKRIWDTYTDLRIVFTGSMMGLYKHLIKPSSTSPLYGRTPAQLILKPFTKEQSRKFLINGFRELNMEITEDELEKITLLFNGYVGWLTYYGNMRCIRKLSPNEALKKTIDEGVKIYLEELENFLRNRRRDLYIKILRILTIPSRWSEIKSKVNINSKVLRDILNTLLNTMMIEKSNELYQIPDPILKTAITKLKI